MNVTQVRWVLAATIVSESAWVFALLGVVGLAFSMGAGVLGWLAVLAIMSISAFYQLVTVPSDTEEAITFSWRTLGIAAAVVYVAVATEVGEGLLGTDLLWFFRFETWGSAANQPLMGTAAGALLWWRGSRLSSSTDLKESLSFSFRIGVVALAIAVIVDLAVDTNLGTFLPVFVFFAFGLAGLERRQPAARGPAGPGGRRLAQDNRRRGRPPSWRWGWSLASCRRGPSTSFPNRLDSSGTWSSSLCVMGHHLADHILDSAPYRLAAGLDRPLRRSRIS